MAAVSQSANLVEKAIGHVDGGVTEQNMTNPERDREAYGDPSGEKMKALVWMGKNTVQVGKSLSLSFSTAGASIVRFLTDCCCCCCCCVVETLKPKVIEDRDVILKVTGSTICGSDLHLYHGNFPPFSPSRLYHPADGPQAPSSSFRRATSWVTSSAVGSTPSVQR